MPKACVGGLHPPYASNGVFETVSQSPRAAHLRRAVCRLGRSARIGQARWTRSRLLELDEARVDGPMGSGFLDDLDAEIVEVDVAITRQTEHDVQGGVFGSLTVKDHSSVARHRIGRSELELLSADGIADDDTAHT